MKLISACLLGVNCRYNGKNNEKPSILKSIGEDSFIPICPEQLGGLTTPRPPAEIQGGDGEDVLEGKARIINKNGEDVTEAFVRGAKETLKIAKCLEVSEAILKARSPSCGVGEIYDGTFSNVFRKGCGVTTAILKKNGIMIYSDEEYPITS
ncbi:Uncharacterized conserved protein YbbK, DUF523 family [Natronincola peptidivorans]|uniref:Uncharacterized conserved protein YbbK, DUF523 family n=1 Tax=Natronincola peptidivorans TaxID=426128 RepID=A0A1I0EYB3_9FIRM|nr:DUF523 domain-containing protein [Natronincola peptidivorans]SET50467.1 Uncharacterized conserved protein YbbK, DUF523 family [Natronincola peptidivorans]